MSLIRLMVSSVLRQGSMRRVHGAAFEEDLKWTMDISPALFALKGQSYYFEIRLEILLRNEFIMRH